MCSERCDAVIANPPAGGHVTSDVIWTLPPHRGLQQCLETGSHAVPLYPCDLIPPQLFTQEVGHSLLEVHAGYLLCQSVLGFHWASKTSQSLQGQAKTPRCTRPLSESLIEMLLDNVHDFGYLRTGKSLLQKGVTAESAGSRILMSPNTSPRTPRNWHPALVLYSSVPNELPVLHLHYPQLRPQYRKRNQCCPLLTFQSCVFALKLNNLLETPLHNYA